MNTFSSASKLKLGENVVDLKQSLLKKTQKKLSDGRAKNPIKVSIKSENQGGVQSIILIGGREIISDQRSGLTARIKVQSQ